MGVSGCNTVFPRDIVCLRNMSIIPCIKEMMMMMMIIIIIIMMNRNNRIAATPYSPGT